MFTFKIYEFVSVEHTISARILAYIQSVRDEQAAHAIFAPR